MAIENRKLSGNNPRLTIDLEEMFGQRIPESQAFRESVGQAIIDEILDRTEDDNVSRRGGKFKKYSKEYTGSLEFKAFGKNKSKVNLTLTGDMLGTMDIISQTRNTITIGWEDSEQAAKAHGHITGNIGVKRDFLGLPPASYDDIRSEFSIPSDEPSQAEVSALATLVSLRDFLFGTAEEL